MSTGSFLKGLAVGAVAGLLMAPKSGKKLRQDLMSKMDDAKDQAKDYTDAAKEKGDELQKQAQDVAGNIKLSLKDTANQMKDQMQNAAGDMKDKAQNMQSESASQSDSNHPGFGGYGREKDPQNYSKGPGVAGEDYNKASDMSGDERFSDYTTPEEFAEQHDQKNSSDSNSSKGKNGQFGEEKTNYSSPGTSTSKQSSDTSGEEKTDYSSPSNPK